MMMRFFLKCRTWLGRVVALGLVAVGLSSALIGAEGEATAAEAPKREATLKVMPSVQYHFGEVWNQTAGAFGPRVQLIREVFPGQLVLLQVFLIDPEASDATHWTYRIAVENPDGSDVKPDQDLELLKGKAAAMVGPRLAQSYISWAAGVGDALGTRTVKVVAHEAATGRELTDRFTFELVEWSGEKAWEPLAEPAKWWFSYQVSPRPQELPGFMAAMVASPQWAKRDMAKIEQWGGELGMFEAIWNENIWLRPMLVARIEAENDDLSRWLSASVAFTLRDDADEWAALPEVAKLRVARYAHKQWPGPTAEPTMGSQLDVWWGRYFATGGVAPLRELVAVLNLAPKVEALQRYREAKPPKGPPDDDVMQGVVFGSAMWSLASNARQHRLVRAYLERMLADPKLTEMERAHLREALETENPDELRKRFI